ncbi:MULTISPECIES: hypothetical protein [unclassified Streptomyces]|uniref:hypothetical protein n=1 Tax=unclassified Streptomyces TaxID=2593676 RepID=UPI00036CA870|nr:MULTISPECIES: hypothetical protein [unclassified Streptomyces]MYT29192.1 hypothetical protein [Streptomyces sp. SID8354]
MTPPPRQDPAPYAPRRRPYGSVRLAAPIAPTPSRPRPGREPRRWYGPRVPLPPLSMGTLRRRDSAGRRD